MSRAMISNRTSFFCLAAVCALAFFNTRNVNAHCDTLNGPVIPEAVAALEQGDVIPILKWVKKDSETELRTAFAKALAVRAKGAEARELADQYFLETLVRLHRAGEGAPYTGIKDEPVDPVAAMADQALNDGSADAMIHQISGQLAQEISEKFKTALETRKNKDRSVDAGREFVEAYVAYVHYVEGIHSAITTPPAHGHEAAAVSSAKAEQHEEHLH